MLEVILTMEFFAQIPEHPCIPACRQHQWLQNCAAQAHPRPQGHSEIWVSPQFAPLGSWAHLRLSFATGQSSTSHGGKGSRKGDSPTPYMGLATLPNA